MSKYDEDDEIHWSDEDRLFDSPVVSKTRDANGKVTEPQAQSKAQPAASPFDAEEAREAALRQELENVRKINQVIEGVVDSLEKAKSNMDTVSRTVNSASTLLQTWTRILSQTEHNQRLILNPAWQGATRDIADIESEEVQRQRDAQRRQIEEQQRREAAARKAEEDERRRAEAAARGTRVTRGKARGSARGTPTPGASSSTSSGYGRGAGRGGTTGTSRSGTAIGRGLRGRARG